MTEVQKLKIDDVCDVVKGKTGIKKAIPGKYPMITLASERASHNEYQFDCKAAIVQLVSSTGHGHASINRIHYQEGKFAMGSILAAVIPRNEKKLHPKYLHIYLSYFKDELLVPLMRGAANVSLSIGRIESAEILVPSYEKQLEIIKLEKIVSGKKKFLGLRFNDQKNYIQKLRQAILQDAIEGRLTTDWRKKNPTVESASELLKKIKAEKEKLIAKKKIKKEKPLSEISKANKMFNLPEKWEWCYFSDLVHFHLGKTPPSKDTRYWSMNENDFPWVSIADMTEYGTVIKTKKKVTKDAMKNIFKRDLVKMGTLIMSFKLTIGRTSILGLDSYHNEAIISIYPFAGVLQKYLFYFLPIFSSWGDKRNAIKGATLNSGKLLSLPIPLPPLPEQKVIVEKIETLMQKMDKLEVEISQNKKTADQLMQTVLKEAFEGK